MFFIKSDRWFLNNIIDKDRVFKVKLNECYDEFGGRYGKKNNHFFVEALSAGANQKKIMSILKNYYSKNCIKSFNSIIGRDTGHPSGKCYFLPWEEGRVRPLETFYGSYKIGPTPDSALPGIIDRLCGVQKSIEKKGFNQFWRFDGYIRLVSYEISENRVAYVVRDGNHRISALSHLGFTSVEACQDSDHFRNSKLFRMVANFYGKPVLNKSEKNIVKESDVYEWPHVKAGHVSAQDAINFFRLKINTFNKNA